MNMKKVAPIISILSVAVMILWGALIPDGWSKSWLAVFVGGAIIAVLNIIYKGNDGNDGNDGEDGE